MVNRMYKFDNLKFLLILFVVVGHFVNLYCNQIYLCKKIFIFIYTFHMPLFIFISGLFTKKVEKIQDINIKKILFYLILIILMKTSIFFVCSHFNINMDFKLFSGDEDYWFLGSLIAYSLIIPIINKFNLKFLLFISIILGLFVGYDSTITDYFYLSRIIVFFPYFLLGYIFSFNKKYLVNICDKRLLKIMSIIIIVFVGWICFFKLDSIYKYRMLFTARNSFSSFVFHCTYKDRLIVYFISFIMGFSVMCLIPNKKIKIISNMGTRTLSVFVLHKTIIYFCLGIGLFDYLLLIFDNMFIYVYLILSVMLTFFLSLSIFNKLLKSFNHFIFID